MRPRSQRLAWSAGGGTGLRRGRVTASTFILIGLCGVQLGDHQRFVFWWSFSVTIVMTIACLVLGVLPLPRF